MKVCFKLPFETRIYHIILPQDEKKGNKYFVGICKQKLAETGAKLPLSLPA